MDPVVLVVDDNDDNRFTLSMHLETCGYSNIVTAENGREALEKMRSGPVDLVLLDIMMPELDGYGVLEEMRSDVALRDIPVVMISALEDINSVVRCVELGATDYLTKPFNPVLLRARVDNCIEKSRYRAQEVTYHERIESERRRADELLATVLPRPIVRALKRGGRLAPRRHEDVAVLFCDVVGFTAYSEKNPPEIVFAEQGMGSKRSRRSATRSWRPPICFHTSTSRCAPSSPALSTCWPQRGSSGQTGQCGSGSIMGRSRPGPWARHNSNSTFGATRSTPPRGSRRPAGRAPSTSAAALGSICATEHRAAR